MKAWLWRRHLRAITLVGIGALCILDVTVVVGGTAVIGNDFWGISAAKAYHLAFWTAWGALVAVNLASD